MQSGVQKYGVRNVRHVSPRCKATSACSSAEVPQKSQTTPRNNDSKRSANNNTIVATVTVYNSYANSLA